MKRVSEEDNSIMLIEEEQEQDQREDPTILFNNQLEKEEVVKQEINLIKLKISRLETSLTPFLML